MMKILNQREVLFEYVNEKFCRRCFDIKSLNFWKISFDVLTFQIDGRYFAAMMWLHQLKLDR